MRAAAIASSTELPGGDSPPLPTSAEEATTTESSSSQAAASASAASTSAALGAGAAGKKTSLSAPGNGGLASSAAPSNEPEEQPGNGEVQPFMYNPCDHSVFMCTTDEVCPCVANQAFCEKFCLCGKDCTPAP